jgi:hypothetical protein
MMERKPPFKQDSSKVDLQRVVDGARTTSDCQESRARVARVLSCPQWTASPTFCPSRLRLTTSRSHYSRSHTPWLAAGPHAEVHQLHGSLVCPALVAPNCSCCPIPVPHGLATGETEGGGRLPGAWRWDMRPYLSPKSVEPRTPAGHRGYFCRQKVDPWLKISGP